MVPSAEGGRAFRGLCCVCCGLWQVAGLELGVM